MKKINLTIAAVTAVLLSPAIGSTIILTESFESPNATTHHYQSVGVGTQSYDLAGWNVTNAGTFVIDHWNGFDRASWKGNTLGPDGQTSASHGDQYLQLQTSNTGIATISRSVATQIGTEYTLSFDYGAIAIAVWDLTFEYEVDGTTQQIAVTTKDGQIGWETQEYTFTATKDLTSLSFTGDTENGFYGISLDNVTITAVPEPTSAALIGLGGLALLLRRQR